MSTKVQIASFLALTVASGIITGALSGSRRRPAARPSSGGARPSAPRRPYPGNPRPSPSVPAPENPPTSPSSPTEQPRPRAPSAEFHFTALNRYQIVADVLPVAGVGLVTVATKALAHLKFDGASLKSYKSVQREDVGEVTRVTFVANSIIDNTVSFDRQYSIGGVGSVWLVSAEEVGT